MGIIESLVRKAVIREDSECLGEQSQQIMKEMQQLENRLLESEEVRRKAEAQRDKVVFELKRLFHFVPAYFIFKDSTGHLLQVNEMTARGFGLTPEEMIGHHQREFWPAEQCDRFEEDDREIMESGEGKWGYLEEVQCGDEVHIFRTWKAPMFNGRPGPIGIMLFAVDITLVGDHDIKSLGQFGAA